MQLIDISKILALCLFRYGISKNVFNFDNLTWHHIFYFNQKDTSTVFIFMRNVLINSRVPNMSSSLKQNIIGFHDWFSH